METPPVFQEKDAAGPFENETELKHESDDDNEEVRDLFVPLPPLKGVREEKSPLTFRAVMVGVVLGTLVNASNVYLGEWNPESTCPVISGRWLLHLAWSLPVARPTCTDADRV